MDELGGDDIPWDLPKHLNGCLAGYQSGPTFENAVYFGLEAIWGVVRDAEVRAKLGNLDPTKLDPEWSIAPLTEKGVQWIWLRAIATAWTKYKTEGGPLGHAFGLEGGQGTPPIHDRLMQRLDERAIARWVCAHFLELRSVNAKAKIEDAIQDAVDKFEKSDVTIRRAWARFGRLERQRIVATSQKP